MSNTRLVPTKSVRIDRGSSVICVDVPEHEIDVLRAVHGVAEVQVTGDGEEPVELSDSADEEWARMQRKYKRTNSPDFVGIAHRVGPKALEAFGFHLGRGASQAAPQSGARKHPKPEPEKAAKKAA